jgi:putative MATE family efflux protein
MSAESVDARMPSRWQRTRTLLREAISGQEHDYTSGSIGRAVLLLAIPMMLEMLMESVFAVVDIFWVSSLGADSIAVVGLTEAVLTLLYAIAVGLSMAVTALVARRIGAGDPEAAARVAGQTIWVGVASAALIAAIGIAFADDILRLMGATPEVVAIGTGYTTLMLGGSVTILLLFLLNAVLRGAGNAALAMRVLWVANAINIVLGPLFIFGIGPFPDLGVTGAAPPTSGAGSACCTRSITSSTAADGSCCASRTCRSTCP